MSAEEGGAPRALSRQGLQLCEVRVGRAADSRSNASVRSANVGDEFPDCSGCSPASATRRDNVDVELGLQNSGDADQYDRMVIGTTTETGC